MRNVTAAIQFLLDTSGDSEIHYANSYTKIAAGYAGCVQWDELHSLMEFDGNETRRILTAHQLILDAGIDSSVLTLNGRPIRYTTNPEDIISECRGNAIHLQQIVSGTQLTTWNTVDVVQILSVTHLVVPHRDAAILDLPPISLGVREKSLSQQMAFMDWMTDVQWNRTDPGQCAAFYILFSKNQTEINVFMTFAKQHHASPASFAVNPPIPARLLRIFEIDLNETTLIANGRIIHAVIARQLAILDAWISMYVTRPLKRVSAISHKRSQAMMYLGCIVTDLKAENAIHKSLADDTWNIQTPLIGSTERGLLHWDIVMDPFSSEYQRIADILDYLSERGVLDVRIVVVPPAVVDTMPATYYRGAYSTDNALFTMLNDTTTYSVLPNAPDAWIIESLKAVVDLDNILIIDLPPGVHEGKYILTNMKAEGVTALGETSFAEGVELALLDPRGRRKSDTISMRSSGYWQLSTNPGKWTIQLGGRNSKILYRNFKQMLVIASFALS
jgi:UDP-glucose:glycoprotein glucosyltransferase